MNEYDLPIPERGLVAHPALKLEVTVYVPSARLESEKKVLVHPYGNELLKDYLRVSVGSVKSMKIFLNAFFAVDLSD